MIEYRHFIYVIQTHIKDTPAVVQFYQCMWAVTNNYSVLTLKFLVVSHIDFVQAFWILDLVLSKFLPIESLSCH